MTRTSGRKKATKDGQQDDENVEQRLPDVSDPNQSDIVSNTTTNLDTDQDYSIEHKEDDLGRSVVISFEPSDDVADLINNQFEDIPQSNLIETQQDKQESLVDNEAIKDLPEPSIEDIKQNTEENQDEVSNMIIDKETGISETVDDVNTSEEEEDKLQKTSTDPPNVPAPAVFTNLKPLKEIFTCEDCGEMYQGLNFYTKHVKEEHGKDVAEESSKTPSKTWKPYFVIHAGRGKSPPPDYQEFNCVKCDFIASTSAALDDHCKEAHKPKARVPCDACGKDFARKWELQVHVKTVHLGIKDQQCPQCDYRSADKGRVQKHLKMVHWKVKDYQCDQCDYAGASTSSLKNHIKAIHLKLREFKCDYCDHTAVQKGQINSHMRAVHLNIKPFECNLCNFRAGDNATLKKHIRIRHEKIRDHLCPHCGYGSSNLKQLNAHIEKRHLHPKRRKLKPIPIVGMKLKSEWTPPKPKRPRK